RIDQSVPYREGVVLAKPVRAGRSWANVGLRKEIQIDRVLKPGVRITVEMPRESEEKEAIGRVVSPRTPREVNGTYWGYQVRLAASFSRVLTEAPFEVGIMGRLKGLVRFCFGMGVPFTTLANNNIGLGFLMQGSASYFISAK